MKQDFQFENDDGNIQQGESVSHKGTNVAVIVNFDTGDTLTNELAQKGTDMTPPKTIRRRQSAQLAADE